MAITRKVITAVLHRSNYWYKDFPITATLTYTNGYISNIKVVLTNPDPGRTSNFWETSNSYVSVKTNKGEYGTWFSTFGANGNAEGSTSVSNSDAGDNPQIIVYPRGVAAFPSVALYQTVDVYENDSSTPVSGNAYAGAYKAASVLILG